VKKRARSIATWVIIFAIFFIMYMMVNSYFDQVNKKNYSDLIQEIKSGEISRIVVGENTVSATKKTGEKLPNGMDKLQRMEVEIPSVSVFRADVGQELLQQIDNGTLQYEVKMPKAPPWWLSLIGPIIMVVVVVFFWFFVIQQQSGSGKAGGFTRNRAKLAKDDPAHRVTFQNVAGAEEEKAELEELVEFLKNPQKFIALGARIPKGVLLVGPPGTGKTLLAKAVAGEAGVPFFSISGSDFVELYVGVGASRVRDLFEQAKKSRPCIIFIDEIDAVGRHRGAGMGGGHDEREQTLNQLLVEMDGFGANEGIIMMAATNRPDILDPALLRPGRFDRQVVVDVPDVKGREEILKVHSNKKPLSSSVDLKRLAKATGGYTGADLENLMNEAAIFAARRDKKEIDNKDLEDANLKVMMGAEKRSKVITDKERKLTAYHEAGHAILAKMLDSGAQVHQVSIIPRGRAGGYTMYVPEESKMYASKNEMLDQIVILLGGRVAEKLVLDDISTGASNDIQRASELARQMVARYGMSDKIGPVSYDSGDQEVFLGRDYGHSKNYSEQVASQIDSEVSSIIEKQYQRTIDMLKEHMDVLKKVAEVLLEKETIDTTEFEEIFEQTKKGENE
jgi:cell division protease FtsH